MENVSVTTRSGEEIILEAVAINTFASHLRGPMLRPGDFKHARVEVKAYDARKVSAALQPHG